MTAMSNVNRYGLIILGNSGVGKSFSANILVGRDNFLHQFKATSVTQTTESIDATIGSYKMTIFDIPGLIEAEQERIDLNKKEIDKAFTQRPNSIIIFMFGQKNGRIRGEDVVAFNAINVAYPFRPESLILIVNGVPKNRPTDYEETTLILLQKLLKGANVNNTNLYFTDFINENDTNERQALRNRLLPIVSKFVPMIHEKKQDIQTIFSEINDREKEIKVAHDRLKAERDRHEQQIAEQKRLAEEKIAEVNRRQAELQRQELERKARLAEHKRKMDAQHEAHKREEKRLRDQIANAGMTVPAGQTHYSNVVLAGNTFHVHGTMQGYITGYGTIRTYSGSKLNGGIDGTAIDIMASGSLTLGGTVRCRNITFC